MHAHYAAVLERSAARGQCSALSSGGQEQDPRPGQAPSLIVDLIEKENGRPARTSKETPTRGCWRKRRDSKSGAGQYFTPRPLIRAIVEVLRPQPMHRYAIRRAAPVVSCWCTRVHLRTIRS